MQGWEQQEEESCRRERDVKVGEPPVGRNRWWEALTKEDEESGLPAGTAPGHWPAPGCRWLVHIMAATAHVGREPFRGVC